MRIIHLYFIVFCALFVLPYSTVMAYEESNYEVIVKNEIYIVEKLKIVKKITIFIKNEIFVKT